MPKPTRAERRRLAGRGKLQPRRPAPISERPAVVSPTTAPLPGTPSSRAVRSAAATEAVAEPAHVPDAQEYAYVKSDLLRIFVLAVLITGGMVVLRFVLPQ
jgi:hypothetical protein